MDIKRGSKCRLSEYVGYITVNTRLEDVKIVVKHLVFHEVAVLKKKLSK